MVRVLALLFVCLSVVSGAPAWACTKFGALQSQLNLSDLCDPAAAIAALGLPSSAIQGGVASLPPASHLFVTGLASGILQTGQPSFSDLAGTASNGQLSGAYTGITGLGTLGALNVAGISTLGTVQAGNVFGAGSVVAATGSGNVSLNVVGLGTGGIFLQAHTDGTIAHFIDSAAGAGISSFLTFTGSTRGVPPIVAAAGDGTVTSLALASASGAVLTFSAVTAGTIGLNDLIADTTNPAAIPNGTYVSVIARPNITASSAAISPSPGDTITFTQTEVPLTLSPQSATGQSSVNIFGGGLNQNIPNLTGTSLSGGNGYAVSHFRIANDTMTSHNGVHASVSEDTYGGGDSSGVLSGVSGAVLTFPSPPSPYTVAGGWVVYDETNPAAWGTTNTTVVGTSGNTITLSNSAGTPIVGDTIQFLPAVGERGGMSAFVKQNGPMGDWAAHETQPGGVGMGAQFSSAYPATVGASQSNLQGLMYGSASGATLSSGATNWGEIIGDEHDLNTDAGSSYGEKTFQKWVMQTSGNAAAHGYNNNDIGWSLAGGVSGAYLDFGGKFGRDNSNWPFAYAAAIANGGKGSILLEAQLGQDWLTLPDAPALGGISLNQVMFATPAQGGFAFRSYNMRIGSDGSYGVGGGYLSSTPSGASLDVSGAVGTGTPSIVAAGTGYDVGSKIFWRDGIWRVTNVNGSGGVTGIAVYTDSNGNARQPSYPANTSLPGTVTPYTDTQSYGAGLGATGLQIGLSWTTPGTLALGATAASAISIGNSVSTTTFAGAVIVPLATGTPATYACLTTGGALISSAGPC